ncbi:50S ribosomal protein L11 methyltransferase [Thiohalocapsa marina]|uniref:Ribosomal protein L11 methyltransferase n=2 Tax=Thiohalocapsa marina TaxID=424902 RepID=A0A5M8FNQ4_9GAMM|nr:50S ribosomal protein L11 methyltransferase [Thiohalocapsa marina]
MAWLQLELVVEREQAPLIEAALENGGALAVTIDDAADDPVPEPILEPLPNATPLWRRVRITALYQDDANGSLLAEQAAAQLGPQSLAPAWISRLEDQPWERVWLQDLGPQRFGRRLWVCPQGQRPALGPDPDPDPGADAASEPPEPICIDLDPGLAFGTGHHPTTALCLGWLDGLALTDRVVLDYGCGSGILAIAALKLGARQAIAVDHDPQALDATVDNAIANGVLERLVIARPEAMPAIRADVIVANILAGPLVELAPTLTALAAPGAVIGLSGVLSHQAAGVADAYRDGFLMEPPVIQDDWALLTGHRLSP